MSNHSRLYNRTTYEAEGREEVNGATLPEDAAVEAEEPEDPEEPEEAAELEELEEAEEPDELDDADELDAAEAAELDVAPDALLKQLEANQL